MGQERQAIFSELSPMPFFSQRNGLANRQHTWPVFVKKDVRFFHSGTLAFEERPMFFGWIQPHRSNR
ncbi:hypothetical protein Cenrod_2678 [Candidatus Symbiobacter mobilis CR]|uniref:Uncharacterized protein n=1 Tax=Candidatus Symbiobacter mobilis CR TaxID=946483 RepID=U5NER4_9BURK|nr:hypothetical protein Cenrod_2678 [Candidatus Symbiobacter mobilis CR]